MRARLKFGGSYSIHTLQILCKKKKLLKIRFLIYGSQRMGHTRFGDKRELTHILILLFLQEQ
jgi:hypothetical protein